MRVRSQALKIEAATVRLQESSVKQRELLKFKVEARPLLCDYHCLAQMSLDEGQCGVVEGMRVQRQELLV